jgi:hypothetical protein
MASVESKLSTGKTVVHRGEIVGFRPLNRGTISKGVSDEVEFSQMPSTHSNGSVYELSDGTTD